MRYSKFNSYSPRPRRLKQPAFGLWFSRYIRLYSGYKSAQEYANAIGQTESFIKDVIAGKSEPCRRIISDMKYRVSNIEIEYEAIDGEEQSE